MRKYIILIVLVSCLSVNGQEKISNVNTELLFLNNILVIAPAFLTVMGIHEVGHYSMAKVFGAENVKFGLIRSNPNEGFQIGWTKLNDSLSSFGYAMFDLGGVLFSRGFSELSQLTIESNIFPTFINRYFAMTYLIGRFDYSRYVFQDALTNMFGGTGSDMDGFVSEIAGKSTGWRTLIYSSMLTIGVLDLVLNWDEIRYHWSILSGSDFKRKIDEKRIKFGVIPYKNNINFAIQIKL